MKRLLAGCLMILFFLFGCGGGGDSSGTGDNTIADDDTIADDNTIADSDFISISGQFGSSYAFYKKRWYDYFVKTVYATYGQIAKSLAVPIISGQGCLEYAQEFEIEADGSFSVELEKSINGADANWIILIEETDGDIYFLSIPTVETTESLIVLPVAEATEDIDLGDIDSNDDEAQSEITIDELATKVTYNIEALEEIAEMDNTLKSIVNTYLNSYNIPEDETINGCLSVGASGDYFSINSEFSTAENYSGYAVIMNGGNNSVLANNFTEIYSNDGTLQLTIPPGGTIYDGTDYYDFNNPVVSSASETIAYDADGTQMYSCGAFYWVANGTDGSVGLNVLPSTSEIPPGIFELQLRETEAEPYETIGKYIFSYNLQLTEDLHLKVPTPALKLDLDENNRILGAFIKWYIYNETTSGYEEISVEALEMVANGYSFGITDYNGISGNTERYGCGNEGLSFSIDYIDLASCTTCEDMYYDYDYEDKYNAYDIGVNINVADIGFRFNFRPDM